MTHSDENNWLLASLPEADRARLQVESRLVRLEKGRALYRPGEHTEFAYFPLDCIVSVVYITAHTAAPEVAVTGREGVVGMETLLDDVAMPRWAMVQVAGLALRVPADMLKQECARSRPLREALMRYMQALIGQMMQLSICNRHHDMRQQFCRLLLSRLDRMDGETVDMSHEALASALGTSMAKVTRVAMDFWSSGAMDQAADHIRILDRSALEEHACDCYMTVREQYDRLLPGWRTSKQPTVQARETQTMPSRNDTTDLPAFGMGAALSE